MAELDLKGIPRPCTAASAEPLLSRVEVDCTWNTRMMSEADRIVRARGVAAAQAAADEAAEAEQRQAALREGFLSQLEAAIGPALNGLKAAGYPGGQMMKLWEQRRFGRKQQERACWLLATRTYPWKDGTAEMRLYLVSNGRLAAGHGPDYIDGHLRESIIHGQGVWSKFPFEEALHALERFASGT